MTLLAQLGIATVSISLISCVQTASPDVPTDSTGPGVLPAEVLALRSSPRLFNSDKDVLNANLHSPYLQDRAKRVLLDADILLASDPTAEGEAGSYLEGSRRIRSNISTLSGAWALTRDPKYREAAMRYLGSLMNWNHISCEANSGTPPDKDMFFCLIYGEQAAEIGIMYDIFRPELTPGERQVFVEVLNRFHLKEALECLETPPWWANKEWSNWNGVCAGGMGIMALAFHDDIPEMRKLIPFVEKSLGEYFKSFIKYDGGCHEGTGYWNYGMHYAMRYLLYWEHATSEEHPAFQIEQLGKALYFPLDFKGLSFGDNDGWGPCGFFFMLAERMDQPAAALKAATRLPERLDLSRKSERPMSISSSAQHIYAASSIPSVDRVEEIRESHRRRKIPVARVYKGLGWSVLADDDIFPSLHLAARGGSSKVTGHGMLDLLSFKCRVNGKLMITDQVDGYNAVTFTRRGTDTYGRSAASKSTIFVDGLGCDEDVECKSTEVVRGDGLLGIRIDGSGIFMRHWRHRMFIGRLFLMIENRYWLVIDHVYSPNSVDRHWAESRFYTFAKYASGDDWVALEVDDQEMMMSFASLGEAVLQESKGLPIAPTAQSTIIRWMGARSRSDNLHVTALNPGNQKLAVEVDKAQEGEGYRVVVRGEDGYRRTIRFSPELVLEEP